MEVPSWWEVLQSGKPVDPSPDGKAGTIVRSVGTRWNMVEEVDASGGTHQRELAPAEEEVSIVLCTVCALTLARTAVIVHILPPHHSVSTVCLKGPSACPHAIFRL